MLIDAITGRIASEALFDGLFMLFLYCLAEREYAKEVEVDDELIEFARERSESLEDEIEGLFEVLEKAGPATSDNLIWEIGERTARGGLSELLMMLDELELESPEKKVNIIAIVLMALMEIINLFTVVGAMSPENMVAAAVVSYAAGIPFEVAKTAVSSLSSVNITYLGGTGISLNILEEVIDIIVDMVVDIIFVMKEGEQMLGRRNVLIYAIVSLLLAGILPTVVNKLGRIEYDLSPPDVRASVPEPTGDGRYRLTVRLLDGSEVPEFVVFLARKVEGASITWGNTSVSGYISDAYAGFVWTGSTYKLVSSSTALADVSVSVSPVSGGVEVELTFSYPGEVPNLVAVYARDACWNEILVVSDPEVRGGSIRALKPHTWWTWRDALLLTVSINGSVFWTDGKVAISCGDVSLAILAPLPAFDWRTVVVGRGDVTFVILLHNPVFSFLIMDFPLSLVVISIPCLFYLALRQKRREPLKPEELEGDLREIATWVWEREV